MKRILLWLSGLALGISLFAAAQADTVVTVTQVAYDSVGRPTCTAERMNPGAFGSLPASACTLGAQGTYGSDRITHTQYDAAGEVTEVDQAYGVTTANGFPQTLQRIAYPSPSVASGAVDNSDIEYVSYDANGNKKSWQRRNGKTITYNYDALNRELTRSVSDGSVQTVYSGYDLQSHVLYARYGSASGAGLTNVYDALGRLADTVDMNGRQVSCAYNQASVQTLMWYPDGNAIGYSLDNANRLTSAGYDTYTGLFAQSYDTLGRRASISRGAGGTPYVQISYAYDNVGRLTGLTNDLAGTAYDVAWGFAYNPAGQVVSTSASSTVFDYKETNSTTVNQTYDGLNRDAAIAAISGGYDADGNLANDGTRLFYYDVYNRLIGVGSSAYPQNGPYLTLTYDPLGRLASQTDYGTTTSFLYDGTNLIGEYDGSGNMLERYIHGDGVDEPLVWFHGSGTSDGRFFIQDYHGSVIGYTNDGGDVLDLYKYGPYGEPKNIGNITDFTGARFRYTGQMVIPEASLYYYKARVYDPIFGRFLQTDPIGSKDDLDLYAYVGDDPTDKTDPSGNAGFGISFEGFFAVGTYAGYLNGAVAVSVDRNGHVEIGVVGTTSQRGVGLGGGATVGPTVFRGNVSGLANNNVTATGGAGEISGSVSGKAPVDSQGHPVLSTSTDITQAGGGGPLPKGGGGIGAGGAAGGAVFDTSNSKAAVRTGELKQVAHELVREVKQVATQVKCQAGGICNK